MTEFAIVVPALLLIMLAILDFGRAVYAYNVVAHCAREGARYAQISTHTAGETINKVKSMAVGLNPDDLTVGISQPTVDTIQVDVIYRFHPITPLIRVIWHEDTMALHSASTMYTGF